MAKVTFKPQALGQITNEVEKRLIAIGFILEGDIKRSMVGGTGQVYRKGKKRDIFHRASAPGSPPAVDTGRLRASISTNWSGSGINRGVVGKEAQLEDGIGNPGTSPTEFRVVVGTNVEYAPFLEFGTKRMAARPFMRPAWDKYKTRIEKMLGSSVLARK